MVLNKLIDSLTENIEKPKTRQDIDLILDGGAFRGSYTMGALYFLKRLESKYWIKIHRISGCSIGSIAGLVYISDKLDLAENFYIGARNHFIKHFNLGHTKKWLYDFNKKFLKKNDYEKFNDRLFITYWDVTNCRQIVKSKFKNNDDLIETVIRSCFVPYVFNGKMLWKNRYVDGFYPYIFPKESNRKLMAICIMKSNHLFDICCIKNEINNLGRIYEGILETYLFFKKKPSKYCCYFEDWSVSETLFFYFRIFLAYYMIICYYTMNRFFPKVLLCNDKCFLKDIAIFFYKSFITNFCI